ncbi:MAG: hypothetical protein AAF902_17705 [Chloroflexota bacterium]
MKSKATIKPTIILTLPVLALAFFISACGSPAEEINLAAIPTVAQIATVAPTDTPILTDEQLPPTFTPEPTAEVTVPPTEAPILPTEISEGEGSNLTLRGDESMPSLLPKETPLPTVTASPMPTLEPQAVQELPQFPGLPPFESGPVVKNLGSGFGPQVRTNDRLDFVKIGFHTGSNGDNRGINAWMQQLDAAGIPFFLKAVDDAGPLADAQAIAKNSGVPHVLVYRRAGGNYELPNYFDDPIDAAREHWQRHLDAFPPELDPTMVWIESANEVDKGRSEWMAAYSLEIAKMAVRDGYKYAAFAWSSGEPDYVHWMAPNMQEFLRFAAEHPNNVAVSLHEYSYTNSDLFYNYPFFLGRFQLLYLATDRMGIRRPTVLITEFGWEYRDIPGQEEAMRQLVAAADLYAKYPQVKGAAIWYLGGGYGSIHLKTRQLFEPLTGMTASTYYERPTYPPIDPAIFRDYWEDQGIEP